MHCLKAFSSELKIFFCFEMYQVVCVALDPNRFRSLPITPRLSQCKRRGWYQRSEGFAIYISFKLALKSSMLFKITRFSLFLRNAFLNFLVSNLCENKLISEIYSHWRSQMFFKIGVLKSFATCAGKHLCWNLFLIMLQA